MPWLRYETSNFLLQLFTCECDRIKHNRLRGRGNPKKYNIHDQGELRTQEVLQKTGQESVYNERPCLPLICAGLGHSASLLHPAAPIPRRLDHTAASHAAKLVAA